MKNHKSANNDFTDTIVGFFKQESTFNEELAKEILEIVPCKADFKSFMQHFGLLLPPKKQAIEAKKFVIPVKKIPVNQAAKIKSLMERIRRGSELGVFVSIGIDSNSSMASYIF